MKRQKFETAFLGQEKSGNLVLQSITNSSSKSKNIPSYSACLSNTANLENYLV